VVLREREQLVALRAYQRGLVMHQLKYLDEIRPMDEIGNLNSLQKVDSRVIVRKDFGRKSYNRKV
jgi:DNA end-binding protein Ku